MKRVLLVVLATILLGGLLLTSCTKTTPTVADTGQTYELKMAVHASSRASIVGNYYKPWAEAVKTATNGRVTVTIYAEETLVKEADQYDAVVSGLADIAACAPDATPGRFPLAEFVGLPLMFPNAKVGANVAWDILQQFCEDEYKDVEVLGVAIISPAQYWGGKEVKVPSDLNGLRMRSGGKVESWILQETGATPVDISTGDLATSMERKLADGAFLTWGFGKITGVKAITQYRTELNLFYRAFMIVMNKQKFNSMPKVLQDAILSVSGQAASVKYSVIEEAGAPAEKAEAGGTIYMPTKAEMDQWTAAVMPVWDKWVTETGGDAKSLINKMKELTKKYSAQ